MRLPLDHKLRALLARIEDQARQIREEAGYLDTGPGGQDATALAKELGRFSDLLEYLTEDTREEREGPTR